ncbi:protein C19orf12-like [Varanus komodoensis]|uniref:Uncharacterized protein n=1 Tax=Varanus komodoensis TaxID=61221 RepID=A0A8D2L613_VARKO|nr:protein C19orf12-like [Varanus komodoensis]
MLGGPLSIAVGSTVGSLAGASMSTGQFKLVPQILLELPPMEQQRLYDDTYAILRNLDWTDLAQITALVTSSASLQAELQGVVATFLTNDFHAEIQYAA